MTSKYKRRIGPLTFEHFRIWSKVDPTTGCWVWDRAVAWNGYGVVRCENKKTHRAHRKSYQLFHGKSVPRHIDVCHTCDNRACVNPDHLFEGTRTDNMRDCAQKGRIKIPMLRGSQLTQSKLSEADVLAIRMSTLSQRKIAAQFSVSRRTISFIQQRKTWRHV